MVGGREVEGEAGTEISGVARLDLLRRRRAFEDTAGEELVIAADLLEQMRNASAVMDAHDDMAEYGYVSVASSVTSNVTAGFWADGATTQRWCKLPTRFGAKGRI